MSFNEDQEKAIQASSKIDLLITAGAGSGKTKVLSERVYRLVDRGEVTPESLLVLTFTNNASYEMKDRILKRFGPDHPLYPRMLSCHVQSFDSFRAYLVRAYAETLNVPKTFVVMPSSIEDEKRSRFVAETVAECYVDPDKRKKLIAFLAKFGFKNEKQLQDSVLYLSKQFAKLSPKERQAYFDSYASRFFTEEGLRKIYEEQVNASLEQLRQVLRKAAFLNAHHESIASDIASGDIDGVCRAFSLPSDWQGEVEDKIIDPSENEAWAFLPEFYADLCSFLPLSPEEAVKQATRFVEEHPDYFGRAGKKGKLTNEEQNRLKAVHGALKESKSILLGLAEIGSFEEAEVKALWAREQEEFLLDLTREVSDKLSAYKKSVNAFSFADIGFLAISLFEDPEYKKQADEIAARFDYIMVDEYQDNDDSQELLLAGLSKSRPDGSRAHLFCVGDAKQSIYAFRGSNLNLFRNRAALYRNSENGEVIAMNRNYRSAARLLSDINYIFSSYMRPDNGGIDYLDPAERLQYDHKVNLYKEDAGNYGVRRIIPPSAFHLQKKRLSLEPSTDATYEATAILHDIQQKMKEGHLVFDRSIGALRPCQYSDFAILVRRKKHVAIYQRLFLANNVPLNNQVTVDLREVSPTMLLRSILGLLANRLYGESRDEAHLFASIARSYAFRYDDAKLHHILIGDGIKGDYSEDERVSISIHNDPIFHLIDAFVSAHKDSSFERIFLDVVETFHVVSALPYLGEVEPNVSKIESLFSMAMAEKDLGVGLSDFIAFFDSIENYDIALSSETVSESKDAVDLMTIHASKGLERKIVYMPSSDSGKSGGDHRGDPPFDFSLNRGICFPYLGYEIPDNVTPDMEIGGSVSTLRTYAYNADAADEEIHEHVRILYVSLTRAENSFYLVGRELKESGYVMMKRLPTHVEFDPSLLENARKGGYFNADAFKRLRDVEGALSTLKLPLNQEEMGESYELALRLFDEYVIQPIIGLRDQALYEFLEAMYDHYEKEFVAWSEDKDFLAWLYASLFYPRQQREYRVNSLSSLVRAMEKAPIKDDDEPDEPNESEESEGEIPDYVPLPKNEAGWEKRLERFAEGILDKDLGKFAPYTTFAKDLLKRQAEVKKVFVDALLPLFAMRFDSTPFVAYESYAVEGFNDETTVYDDSEFAGNKYIAKPTLPSPKVDDTPLTFEVIEKKRASKKHSDPDFVSEQAMERGTHLHRLLELSKLDENNLDFILDPQEKELILQVLRLPLMQKAKQGKAYPEYGYYDTDFDTTGFIDLLFFGKDGTCHIVDYKSANIDDPAYAEQLHAYARNVARIFKVKESDIRLHLLSIGKAEIKDVA